MKKLDFSSLKKRLFHKINLRIFTFKSQHTHDYVGFFITKIVRKLKNCRLFFKANKIILYSSYLIENLENLKQANCYLYKYQTNKTLTLVFTK